MWFFDEAGELLEYRKMRQEVRLLEKEYLDLRVRLRDAQTALRNTPEDPYLQARVAYLAKRIKDLEDQNRWLAADYPLEIALFSRPHA